jgi:hypothetical protein
MSEQEGLLFSVTKLRRNCLEMWACSSYEPKIMLADTSVTRAFDILTGITKWFETHIKKIINTKEISSIFLLTVQAP